MTPLGSLSHIKLCFTVMTELSQTLTSTYAASSLSCASWWNDKIIPPVIIPYKFYEHWTSFLRYCINETLRWTHTLTDGQRDRSTTKPKTIMPPSLSCGENFMRTFHTISSKNGIWSEARCCNIWNVEFLIFFLFYQRLHF